MSRLTKTDISMAIEILKHPNWGDESDIRKAVVDAIEGLKELQHYKDLEEQGRLIEVIRCKDCDNYDPYGYSEGAGWCEAFEIGRFDNGYCDNAKQKELAEMKEGTKCVEQ